MNYDIYIYIHIYLFIYVCVCVHVCVYIYIYTSYTYTLYFACADMYGTHTVAVSFAMLDIIRNGAA